jgi:hypothetical protein
MGKNIRSLIQAAGTKTGVSLLSLTVPKIFTIEIAFFIAEVDG